MRSEKFNLYKIKFILETLKSESEKLEYLNDMKNQLIKVIECFESRKFTSIRNYGSDKHFLDDNCPELKSFVSEMVKSYSQFQNDQRNPSDETLKELVANESKEYKKLLSIIESEIEYIAKGISNSVLLNIESTYETFATEEDLLKASDISVKDEQKDVLMKGEYSKSVLVWKGTKDELINFIDHLVTEKIFSFESEDKKITFLSQNIVNTEGKPFNITEPLTEQVDENNFDWPKGTNNLIRS